MIKCCFYIVLMKFKVFLHMKKNKWGGIKLKLRSREWHFLNMNKLNTNKSNEDPMMKMTIN